jgi:hypothetical protein
MSTEQILAERQTTHGNFTDNADISQHLKRIVRSGLVYNEMTNVQKEAIDMILHKIARAVSGNPHFTDHYADIAGYATLVVNDTEDNEG